MRLRRRAEALTVGRSAETSAFASETGAARVTAPAISRRASVCGCALAIGAYAKSAAQAATTIRKPTSPSVEDQRSGTSCRHAFGPQKSSHLLQAESPPSTTTQINAISPLRMAAA